MNKIAVFVNGSSALCDFFKADCFLIFERDAKGWKPVNEMAFEKIVPSTPTLTRKHTEALLPLIKGCDVLAGGALFGIPYSVFDKQRLHIFEINGISDEIFDEIIADIQNADAGQKARKAVVENACPVETDIPGIYVLDLIALQSEYPEVSSKNAMKDFLENTPFFELQLTCRHIPPWIENSGKYHVETINVENGTIKAIIRRKC